MSFMGVKGFSKRPMQTEVGILKDCALVVGNSEGEGKKGGMGLASYICVTIQSEHLSVASHLILCKPNRMFCLARMAAGSVVWSST